MPFFGALQSRIYEVWVLVFSSTLGDGLRYTPSDCFVNFPFSPSMEGNEVSETTGRAYNEFRSNLMISTDMGMTACYSRFHDPLDRKPDITKLRRLHAEMDDAVLRAYGWDDLADMAHDTSPDGAAPRFLHQTDEPEFAYQKRYHWPAWFRDNVLARLLELNRTRAAEESEADIDGKMKPKALQLGSTGNADMNDASSIKTSAQVRDEILDAFRMDVVGPDTRPAYHDDHMSNFEVITSTHPSSFYLIGYLTPAEGSTAALPGNDAPEIQDPLPSMEDDEEHGAAGGEDSDGGNETRQLKRLDPTSLGLTAFVAPDCPYIDVALRYADYYAQPLIPEAVLEGTSKDAPKDISWHRKPRFVKRRIDASKLADALNAKEGLPIPLLDTETSQRKGGCLHLHVMVQRVDLLRPEGPIDGLSVTIFVVNCRPESQRFRDVSNVFQVGLELKAGGEGFIGNPDMSGYDADDPDLAPV